MANNTYTKTYADGAALTEAKLDSAFTSLQPDLAQTALLTTGATANQVLTVSSGGAAAVWATPADPKGPYSVRNYGLSASTSSGSLIVALKTAAGSNPTLNDIVDVTFSSNGTTSAVPQRFQQTSSLTLSVTASATLGVTTATTATLYVYALRVSSSTLRMAISTNGALDFGAAATSVAMSSASDTEGTLYSNASAGTYPTRLLGWIKASHTAGTWNNIYKVNLDNGVHNPNEIANRRTRATTSTSATIGGIAFSLTSDIFSTSSTAFTNVTNAGNAITAKLKTTGRPVFVGLTADPSNQPSYVQCTNTAAGASMQIAILRDGVIIYSADLISSANNVANTVIAVPSSGISIIDVVAAGTYSYTCQLKGTNVGQSNFVVYSRLVAYEL